MGIPPFGAPPLPSQTGNSGKYLTTNGSASSWGTVSAGGKTLYKTVVAASGGDYTTLTAALAAASSGDTIFVRNGTYTETDPTSALTDITIIGESDRKVVLNYTTASFTISGARWRLFNLGIAFSTGRINGNAADLTIESCFLSITGDNYILASASTACRVINCYISDTNTGTHSNPTIDMGGARGIFSNNYCICGFRVGDSATGWLNINGAGSRASDNTLFANSVLANSVAISVGSSGTRSIVASNNINPSAVNTLTYGIFYQGGNCVINDNQIGDAKFAIYCQQTKGLVVGNSINSSQGSGTIINVVSDDTTVVGNYITCASSSTGINLGGNLRCNITGNTINTASVGIAIAGASGCVVVGNSLRNTTTPITDTSVLTTIKANMGANMLTEKDFMLLKNTSGGTLALGDYVVYKSSVAAGNEFTTTTTASDNLALGQVAESIANNASGLIQTLGKTVNLKCNGTVAIAVGDFLTTFTAAGIVKKAAAGDQAIGIALEAYANADSLGVIDALLIQPRKL